MTTWSVRDLPGLTGITAVVTGANSGVGRSTARALAAAGARVVLAVRDPEKGRRAAAAMPGTTEVRHLDLADLASVRAFAAAWNGPIDLLVNNAGISAHSLTRTADGFEATFGVNHLGHFALTNLLLEHLTGRVVTVASQAERMAQLDLDDLGWEHRPFRQSRAYNDSKLANLLFTAELQRRLTAAGSPVLAHAAHPGLVATGIYQPGIRRLADVPWKAAVALLAQKPDQGALPVLYAAVEDLPGNSFTGPGRLAHMRGAPRLIPRSATAQDPELAARLWEISERLTRATSPV
ncbi:oxidoreductase [Streptomyces sp. SCPE 10]|uniref:oxidoreductase n=1 Tax=Streptomyces sp. SCPE 10 TaxID=3449273 RepID=UPI003F7FA252